MNVFNWGRKSCRLGSESATLAEVLLPGVEKLADVVHDFRKDMDALRKRLAVVESRCPDGSAHGKVYRLDKTSRSLSIEGAKTRDWVCAKCGIKGTDAEPVDEYERLTKESDASS